MKGNVYQDFSGKEYEYNYPYSFELRNKEYLEMNVKPLGTWNYGEAIEIKFVLKSSDVEAAIHNEEITGDLQLTLYNFRYEPVYVSEEQEYSENPVFSIDSTTSKEVFRKGIYFAALRYIDSEVLSDEYVTLLNVKDNYFYVE